MDESQPKSRAERLTEVDVIRQSKVRPEGKFSVSQMQKCFDYGVGLKGKYSVDELQKCRLYHLISGSTVTDEEAPNFDLPGGEIENFIRNEL